MITVVQASMPADRAVVRDLFAEYLCWVCPRIYAEYQVVFDAEEVLARDMETIDIFMPPRGWLFVAFDVGVPAGCASVRQLGNDVAEIKRTYVRPDHRRRGIGRLLIEAAIAAVRESKYSVLRLDSAGFMTEAHALYRSLGFRDRQPYEGSEIPPEHRHHWVFMQLDV